MKRNYRHIHIALPALDESNRLPLVLEMLSKQSFQDFTLHVCVNQPDEWWGQDHKKEICQDNQASLEILSAWNAFNIVIIDRSSRGKGWVGKKHGVGWARKVILDDIMDTAAQDDLVVSLDADTYARDGYLASVLENFNDHHRALAMAVPYYHRLTGEPAADRAILRYEIYMRNYNIHLLSIQSPYAYTALGSAMAFPVWAARKVGGITPVLSGEDFYFLQKMVKSGPIITWNNEKVYPEARFSDRVYFGTGPAMIKGNEGDWESYPIYHHSLFQLILQTYEQFENLVKGNVETPMDEFIKNTFKTNDIWSSLRDNYKVTEKFVHACHSRIDGLRILQFLKQRQKELGLSDESCLMENLINLCPLDWEDLAGAHQDFYFNSIPIGHLDKIRNRLVELEEKLQLEIYKDMGNMN